MGAGAGLRGAGAAGAGAVAGTEVFNAAAGARAVILSRDGLGGYFGAVFIGVEAFTVSSEACELCCHQFSNPG